MRLFFIGESSPMGRSEADGTVEADGSATDCNEWSTLDSDPKVGVASAKPKFAMTAR